MCGICGLVATGRRRRRDVVECSALLAGPPRAGRTRSASPRRQRWIGQNRLAIIDLVTGDPPITNEDGSVAVVLNGEIYNFRRAARSCWPGTRVPDPHGDTEVIAHLAEERRRSIWRGPWTACSRSRSGTSGGGGSARAGSFREEAAVLLGVGSGSSSGARSRRSSPIPRCRTARRAGDPRISDLRLCPYTADVLRWHSQPPARSRAYLRVGRYAGGRALLATSARRNGRRPPPRPVRSTARRASVRSLLEGAVAGG